MIMIGYLNWTVSAVSLFLLLPTQLEVSRAFTIPSTGTAIHAATTTSRRLVQRLPLCSGRVPSSLAAHQDHHNNNGGITPEATRCAAVVSRRSLLHHSSRLATTTWAAVILSTSTPTGPAVAATTTAEREPLQALLYRILRVKEATQQETRLIKTGKYKDIQRANVKLAIRYMIDNYRLLDAFVGAAAYLEGGSSRRLEAGQVGQSAVQNLYTILEYFDSSDVENLKVGKMDGIGGKEELVIKGLEATRRSIDDFVAYFPRAEVEAVLALIKQENDLNEKEFDPSLGKIINLPVS